MPRAMRPRLASLLALLALAVALPAHAGLRHVWAVDDGEKIFRDDLASPLKTTNNPVWDGTTVRLFGAGNEVVAFQLILEADEAGASDVDVAISDLSNGAQAIRGSHPLPAPNDYVGVGVELFTEHYLDIETPSWNDVTWGGFGWNAANNPHLTGWTPDALVPFSAAPGRGGAPFDVAPNTNQGVWVDIYLPKADLPAGLYAATITITASGGFSQQIPLELQVRGFALPDENHYGTMIFFSGYIIGPRYGLAMGSDELQDLLLRFHQMAHRHRVDLIGAGTHEEADRMLGTLTGDAYTAAAGYQGPGEGVGNQLFCVNTYGVQFPDSEEGYRTESDTWVNWFAANAPNTEYFLYLIDEPGEAMVPWMVERAGWIHNNPGPGHDLPVFVTARAYPDLVGSIDIWCWPAGYWGYYPWTLEIPWERGEPVWMYASYRPFTPADCTDEYGIAWRAKAWVGHHWQIPRWFTWESTHWEPNPNEVPNDEPKNVWVNPITFAGGGLPSDTGNGDGTLFYPGRDVIFPDQDRGYPGPIASIRLKMYRRGIQDVEYMWLAEQAGYGAPVARVFQQAVPASLFDLDLPVPGLAQWSNRNADYEVGRRVLAALITHEPIFLDVPSDFWARHEIESCYLADIVRGYANGSYHPEYSVTRDQMAVYIARAIASPTGEAGVPDPPAGAHTFTDIWQNHWAYRYIEYCAAEGIVQGYEGGAYRPDLPVTRDQMAVYVSRAIATPTGEAGLAGYTGPEAPSFTDVGTDHWAYRYIEYAKEHGVVQGYGDNSYHPEREVTRDQMAVYIARAFHL